MTIVRFHGMMGKHDVLRSQSTMCMHRGCTPYYMSTTCTINTISTITNHVSASKPWLSCLDLATSMARMHTMWILWHGLRDIGTYRRTMRSYVQDRRAFMLMKRKIWCVKVERFSHFWVRKWKNGGCNNFWKLLLSIIRTTSLRLNFRCALIIVYPKFAF